MRFIVLIIFSGWLFGGSWYWTCMVRGGCGTNIVDNSENAFAETENALKIFYEEEPVIIADTQFRFPLHDSAAVSIRQLDGILDSIANFMFYNPYVELAIIGQFDRDAEINSSTFSTLGLARADFISQQLSMRGVNDQRVIKLYQNVGIDSLLDQEGRIKEGIQFKFVDRPASETPSLLADNQTQAEIAEFEDPILNYPPLLYFNPNTSYLPMTDSLKEFIIHSIMFLRNNPDRHLMIIGHTANQGDAEYNATLGLERARIAKTYFSEFGLDPNQIVIISRGDTEPLTNDLTDSGQQRNQRIELSIK